MADELTRPETELQGIEEAMSVSDILPVAQQKTVQEPLRVQSDALRTRIAVLAGSGAIARNIVRLLPGQVEWLSVVM